METTVLQRIRRFIEFEDVSDRKFAETIGVPQTTISSLFKRGNEPNIAIISAILKAYPIINMEWLISGNGSMLKLNMVEDENQIADLDIWSRFEEFIINQYPNYIKSLDTISVELNISTQRLDDILFEGAFLNYSEIITLSDSPLNIEWLLTGKGKMLKSEESIPTINVNTVEDGIPYYADLPVSAGQLDTFMQDAEPTGWVKLPGVKSKALFPVVGCSMKPEINPGDVVGIVQMDSWEMVDPDKVYLIITHDERMIKHLALDEEDNSILWCISPNYPKFKINKSDIKFLYRISFCGKLM